MIIIEILLTIQYFHDNNLIYRDLNPNNIIIDHNKNAVVIDFDRMIENNEQNKEIKTTIDFESHYIAPEVLTKSFSFEADVYSLGLLIYFIFNEKNPDFNDNIQNHTFNLEFIEFKPLYIQCTEIDIRKRPPIPKIIVSFLYEFTAIFKIENNYEHFITLFTIIEKCKNAYVQNELGLMFYHGYHISCDVNKAIHYLTLAADQNHLDAQFNLATLYLNGEYVSLDI